MQTLSFQAPEEMAKLLENTAMEFDRSKGYIIRQALEAYLDELDELKAAKQYKSQYNPKENVSFSDIKKKYDLD